MPRRRILVTGTYENRIYAELVPHDFLERPELIDRVRREAQWKLGGVSLDQITWLMTSTDPQVYVSELMAFSDPS